MSETMHLRDEIIAEILEAQTTPVGKAADRILVMIRERLTSDAAVEAAFRIVERDNEPIGLLPEEIIQSALDAAWSAITGETR